MSSVLNRVRRTLEGMCADKDIPMCGVWYGACREKQLDFWNYFVFRRLKTTKNNTSRMDYQTFYQVHIIHEDYIPEGYVERVIEELCKKDAESGVKLRPTNDDVVYDYTFKGSTGMVVEVATITLYHPETRA